MKLPTASLVCNRGVAKEEQILSKLKSLLNLLNYSDIGESF